MERGTRPEAVDRWLVSAFGSTSSNAVGVAAYGRTERRVCAIRGLDECDLRDTCDLWTPVI